MTRAASLFSAGPPRVKDAVVHAVGGQFAEVESEIPDDVQDVGGRLALDQDLAELAHRHRHGPQAVRRRDVEREPRVRLRLAQPAREPSRLGAVRVRHGDVHDRPARLPARNESGERVACLVDAVGRRKHAGARGDNRVVPGVGQVLVREGASCESERLRSSIARSCVCEPLSAYSAVGCRCVEDLIACRRITE